MTKYAGHYNKKEDRNESNDRKKAENILREKSRKMTAVDISEFYGISVANFYSALNRYDLYGGQKCPIFVIREILGKASL